MQWQSCSTTPLCNCLQGRLGARLTDCRAACVAVDTPSTQLRHDVNTGGLILLFFQNNIILFISSATDSSDLSNPFLFHRAYDRLFALFCFAHWAALHHAGIIVLFNRWTAAVATHTATKLCKAWSTCPAEQDLRDVQGAIVICHSVYYSHTHSCRSTNCQKKPLYGKPKACVNTCVTPTQLEKLIIIQWVL